MSGSSNKSSKVYSKDSGGEKVSAMEYTAMQPRKQWCRHFKILLKKNYLLAKRSYRATIVQLCVPFVLTVFLFGLQYAVQNNQRRGNLLQANTNPATVEIASIPKCRIGPGLSSCTTLAYSPNNDPVVDQIIADLQSGSGGVLSASSVQSFASPTAFNKYMAANPNSTQGAVHFFMRYSASPPSLATLLGVRYSLQFNTSSTTYLGSTYDPVRAVQLPMQKAVERAVLVTTSLPTANIDFDFNYAPYAHPALAPEDVVSSVGATFYFGALMFNFVIQLSQIVMEKELHLRQTIKQIGVSDSAYWASNLVWFFFINLLTVFMLILSGVIFQFSFYLKNAFGTYFFLYLLFAWSMVPLMFFVSNFVKVAKTATLVGFGIFLVGLFCQIFSSFVFTPTLTWYRVVFSFLPFSILAKGISDISSFSNSNDKTGLPWANRASSSAAFALDVQYNWLIVDFFLLFRACPIL